MTKTFDLPPVSNQINPRDYYIDGTPDGDYALRILKFYRELANCKWVVNGVNDDEKVIYDLMNVHQDQRALELDKAIKTLEWKKQYDKKHKNDGEIIVA